MEEMYLRYKDLVIIDKIDYKSNNLLYKVDLLVKDKLQYLKSECHKLNQYQLYQISINLSNLIFINEFNLKDITKNIQKNIYLI